MLCSAKHTVLCAAQDMFERIAGEAARLMRIHGKRTMTAQVLRLHDHAVHCLRPDIHVVTVTEDGLQESQCAFVNLDLQIGPTGETSRSIAYTVCTR